MFTPPNASALRDSSGQVEVALILCLVVDRKREEKAKKKRKGGIERKEKKKNISLDVFEYRKEKREENVSILYFFYLVCKGKRKEKCILLILCPY